MEQNPQTNPFSTLHKQRLYSLIIAGVAFICLLLPWITVNFGFGSSSANGLRGWGYLSLLGVAGVAIASFMGNKTLPYDDMFKKIALASFAAISLGALIFFFRLNSYTGGGIFGGTGVGSGFGLWICLIAGLAGLAILLGFIKIPDKK